MKNRLDEIIQVLEFFLLIGTLLDLREIVFKCGYGEEIDRYHFDEEFSAENVVHEGQQLVLENMNVFGGVETKIDQMRVTRRSGLVLCARDNAETNVTEGVRRTVDVIG